MSDLTTRNKSCFQTFVAGETLARLLAWQLIGESCWFEITPLPGGKWQITVKEEKRSWLLAAIQQAAGLPELDMRQEDGRLVIRLRFDVPEATGEIVLEQCGYGLYVVAPNVHPVEPVALLDLFYSSPAGQSVAAPAKLPRFNIQLYSPGEREDPCGNVYYHPRLRARFEPGMAEVERGDRLADKSFGLEEG